MPVVARRFAGICVYVPCPFHRLVSILIFQSPDLHPPYRTQLLGSDIRLPCICYILASFFGGFDASADIVVDNGLDLQDLPIIYVTPIREGDATCILYVDWNIIGSILR